MAKSYVKTLLNIVYTVYEFRHTAWLSVITKPVLTPTIYFLYLIRIFFLVGILVIYRYVDLLNSVTIRAFLLR